MISCVLNVPHGMDKRLLTNLQDIVSPSLMVKVLFLDVDGVINVPHGMDKRLLTNLKEIVETTGCKIVLSSDWRKTVAARTEIRGILRSFGMDYISCTPPSKS